MRTDLIDGREAEEAMPLNQFIAEKMAVLGTDADEILMEGAKAFRSNVGPNEHGQVDSFNISHLRSPRVVEASTGRCRSAERHRARRPCYTRTLWEEAIGNATFLTKQNAVGRPPRVSRISDC